MFFRDGAKVVERAIASFERLAVRIERGVADCQKQLVQHHEQINYHCGECDYLNDKIHAGTTVAANLRGIVGL